MSEWGRRIGRWNRRVVRMFPHEFQVRHGLELEATSDEAAEWIWQRLGLWGLVRMLGAAVWWLAVEYVAELRRDVRYGLRRLWSSPGYTAIGVISLALSIGMCSLFYVQFTSMMAPAPGVADPEALFATDSRISYPYFEELRQVEGIEGSAAFLGPTPFAVGFAADAPRERLFGHLVSPDYFKTLGVEVAAGRLFDAAHEKPGVGNAVVISHRLWETRFDGASDVVGRPLQVNGEPATIVGIAGAGFRGLYPMTPAELWVPVSVGSAVAPELREGALEEPTKRIFRAVFRLVEGASLDATEAALSQRHQVLDERLPEADQPRESRRVQLNEAGVVAPLNPEQKAAMYWVNLVLLGMVLAMACANLAILLFARTGERRRDVAVRISVGAGRFRIVREVLTESVLLALGGGVLGAAFTYWLLKTTESFEFRANLPIELRFEFGPAAILFTIGIAVVAGLAFGLGPALAAVRGDLIAGLKQGAQARSRKFARFGMRNQFMVYQLSSSLTILLVTGFVVAGYQKAYSTDLGFESEGIYLAAIDPGRDGYGPEEAAKLAATLPARLGALAGVEAAALSREAAFAQPVVMPNWKVTVPDRAAGTAVEEPAPQAIRSVARQTVGAGYFETLGVRILRGREFVANDQAAAEGETATPAVLNEQADSLLFPAGDGLGRPFRAGDRKYVVVGTAANVTAGLLTGGSVPMVYVPIRNENAATAGPAGISLVLSGRRGDDPLGAAVEHLRATEPELMVFSQRSLLSDVEQFRGLIRWSALTNGSLGVFGLLLCIVGLFGITAGAVARRRKEIGVRVALGATAARVIRLVMGEAAALIAVGGVIGLLGAYAITQVFSSFTASLAEMFDIGIDDPLVSAAVPLLWLVVATLAAYLPARRSLRIDPSRALRAD